MNSRFGFIVGSLVMLGSPCMSQAACSPALAEQIQSAERIIDSLRPEKAGQMRVFATDGSEFTSGQALWMKGQLRDLHVQCAKGDDATVASTLRGVQDLLSAHHKA